MKDDSYEAYLPNPETDAAVFEAYEDHPYYYEDPVEAAKRMKEEADFINGEMWADYQDWYSERVFAEWGTNADQEAVRYDEYVKQCVTSGNVHLLYESSSPFGMDEFEVDVLANIERRKTDRWGIKP